MWKYFRMFLAIANIGIGIALCIVKDNYLIGVSAIIIGVVYLIVIYNNHIKDKIE